MGRKVVEILFDKLKIKMVKTRKLHEFEWRQLKDSCPYRKKASKAFWIKNIPMYGCEKINNDVRLDGDVACAFYFCKFTGCPLIR